MRVGLCALLLACHGSQAPIDAQLDASVDAPKRVCSTEADCEPGKVCELFCSPGGACFIAGCGPTPNFYYALCDMNSSSCTKPDGTVGACVLTTLPVSNAMYWLCK